MSRGSWESYLHCSFSWLCLDVCLLHDLMLCNVVWNYFTENYLIKCWWWHGARASHYHSSLRYIRLTAVFWLIYNTLHSPLIGVVLGALSHQNITSSFDNNSFLFCISSLISSKVIFKMWRNMPMACMKGTAF